MHKGFVLLNCDLGAEEHVLKEMQQMDAVAGAHLTFGAYDLIVEVRAPERESFERVVAEIRSLSNVVSTMTLNVMS